MQIKNYLQQADSYDFVLLLGCQTVSQKWKCLQTAVSIACEAIDQFEKVEKLEEENAQNADILKQFELQLQKILKHLIQVSINKQSDASSIAEYKRIYSSSLQSAMAKEDFLTFSVHLRNLLQAIQKTVV